jgi:hypothetical protein
MTEIKKGVATNTTIDILFAHIEKIYELLGYKCLSVKRNWPEEDFKIILEKLK